MAMPQGAYSQVSSLQSLNQLFRAFVDAGGRLNTTGEGGPVLSDQFDGSVLDVVSRWNSPVTAVAGAAVVAGGLLALSLGTAASSAAAVASIENFYSVGSSAMVAATLIQFEAGAAGLLPLNVHAFFGQGTPNASYTAATPLNNAIGFERSVDGKFSAVYYNTNVRTVVADLTSKIQDGLPHLIFTRVRADTTYFYLDNIEEPVASVNLSGPSTFELPLRMSAINGVTPPSVAPTVRFFGAAMIDTGSSYPVIFNGQALVRARSPFVFKNLNALAVSSEATIWTPATGRKFRLMGFVLTSGTVGGNVVLKDNTAGTTILVLPFGAANVMLQSPPIGNGILSAAVNNVLTATGSATQTLSGFVFGTEE